jgi:hypothetical protein
VSENTGRRCERTAAVLRLRERLEQEGRTVVAVQPGGILVRDSDRPSYVWFYPAPGDPMPMHRRVETEEKFFA